MEVMGGQAPAGPGGLAAVNMGPEALILAVAVAGAGGGPSPTTGSGSSPETDTWTWTWTWKGEWSGQDIALGPTLAALLLLYAALWASVVELRWRVLDLAQQQEEEPDQEAGAEERAETRAEAEAGAEAKQVQERETEQESELKHERDAAPEIETESEAEAEAEVEAEAELEELREPSGAWGPKEPASLCEIGPWTNVPVLGMCARPVRLAAVVVAVRSGLVLKMTTLDARARGLLLSRSQQVILDEGSFRSLRPLRVDLVRMNRCWNNGRFFPRLGAFQEHLLNLLEWEARQARTNILVFLDNKAMKKIYHRVFNAYKMVGDPKVSGLSFQQLLEILLSCKKITTTYIKRSSIAVMVEGEDAHLLNFGAGYGVNLGQRGLESSEELATNMATSGDPRDVFQPLSANTKESREIVDDSKSDGLFGVLFE